MSYYATKSLAEQRMADLQAEARAYRLADEARAGHNRDSRLTSRIKVVARVGTAIIARLHDVRVGHGRRLASGRHGA